MSTDSVPSCVSAPTYYVNPSYGRAKGLVQTAPRLAEMALRVQELARNNPGLGRIEIIRLAKSELFHEFKSIMVDTHNADSPAPALGPPPPANTLYGRFGVGKRIHDFGAGKCMRFARYVREKKLAIEASDPKELPERAVIGCLRSFKKGTIESLVGDLKPNIFLTSWMVLSHVKDLSILDRYDGCHLTIDYGLYDDSNLEPGEYKHDLRGFIVEGGYLLYTNWKSENLSITYGDYTPGDYIPETLCEPLAVSDFDFDDCSFKVDGTFRELESYFDPATHLRKSFITGRNGEQAEIDGINFNMCLHVEETDEAFFLLRVLHWHRFIPPHCYEVLKTFTQRKRISIQGKPLLCPPHYSPRVAIDNETLEVVSRGKRYPVPFDGLICRVDGKDYYTKKEWTIDVEQDSFELMVSGFAKRGFDLNVDRIGPGLSEYIMSIDEEGAVINLRFQRPRFDKVKETPLSTVYHLSTCGTLADIGAFRAMLNKMGQDVVRDTYKALMH